MHAVPSDGARPKRRRTWGYGLLLAGAAALAAMVFAFPFTPGWSFLLLLGGLLLVAAGWVTLAGMGWRSAFTATVAVVLGSLALMVAAPALRSLSWRALVWTHRNALDGAVGILQPVRMERQTGRGEPVCTHLPGLPPGDCAPLQAAMRDAGAHGAWKEGAVTVLETYSSFNARGGLLHCADGCETAFAGRRHRYVAHVAGDWYRWAE